MMPTGPLAKLLSNMASSPEGAARLVALRMSGFDVSNPKYMIRKGIFNNVPVAFGPDVSPHTLGFTNYLYSHPSAALENVVGGDYWRVLDDPETFIPLLREREAIEGYPSGLLRRVFETSPSDLKRHREFAERHPDLFDDEFYNTTLGWLPGDEINYSLYPVFTRGPLNQTMVPWRYYTPSFEDVVSVFGGDTGGLQNGF